MLRATSAATSVKNLMSVATPAEGRNTTTWCAATRSTIAKKFYSANRYMVIFGANKPMLQRPGRSTRPAAHSAAGLNRDRPACETLGAAAVDDLTALSAERFVATFHQCARGLVPRR